MQAFFDSCRIVFSKGRYILRLNDIATKPGAMIVVVAPGFVVEKVPMVQVIINRLSVMGNFCVVISS